VTDAVEERVNGGNRVVSREDGWRCLVSAAGEQLVLAMLMRRSGRPGQERFVPLHTRRGPGRLDERWRLPWLGAGDESSAGRRLPGERGGGVRTTARYEKRVEGLACRI
jgi:hypothetical protein